MKASGFNRRSATDLHADSDKHGFFCLSLSNEASDACPTCPQILFGSSDLTYVRSY